MLNCIRCGQCLSVCPTYQISFAEEEGPRGRITVQVRPLLSTNEGHVLVKSAIAGNGIAFISHYLAADALRPESMRPEIESEGSRSALWDRLPTADS